VGEAGSSGIAEELSMEERTVLLPGRTEGKRPLISATEGKSYLVEDT